MAKQQEQKWQFYGGRDVRVSQALWPVSARRAVAVDRIAQRRRQLLMILKDQWWTRLLDVLRLHPHISFKHRAPETPVPVSSPLVRVLETVDLSRTDIEHLFDAQEGRDMAELAFNWGERSKPPSKV